MRHHDGDRAAPLPRGWSDRARALALPLLLVLVAGISTYRSIALDQSSWQGASFGMFATYDNEVSRSVAVTLVEADGSRRVRVPAELDDLDERLRVVPTDRNAERLAEAVAELAPAGTRRVEVELWGITVDDRGGLRLGIVRLATGAADLAGEP